MVPLTTSACAVVVLLWTFIFVSCSPPPAHRKPCTNPTVRKEWRALSPAARASWISAVKCLAALPHDPALTPSVPRNQSHIVPVNTSSSYHDDLVYIHMDLNTRVHFTGFFLPWHRFYVHAVERALRERCGYKGAAPYWDWTRDAPDLYGSQLFKEDSTEDGLGGWGDPADDFQVASGAFAHGFELAYPAPHRLRRNFTLRPYLALAGSPFVPDPGLMANTTFTKAKVRKMVEGWEGDFRGFQEYFEGFEGAHGSVHLIMGGDLAGSCPRDAGPDCVAQPTHSANEPLFWMHHAMVDKVWYDWQHFRPSANFWAFNGGSVEAFANLSYYERYPNGAPPMLGLQTKMPADGMFEEVEIGEVMDTVGGYLCYVYE